MELSARARAFALAAAPMPRHGAEKIIIPRVAQREDVDDDPAADGRCDASGCGAGYADDSASGHDAQLLAVVRATNQGPRPFFEEAKVGTRDWSYR